MSLCLGTKLLVLDAAGAPLSLGKIYTYATGGTTPKATYSDAAMTVEHANPIVLDDGGQATIYLNGITKFVIKTAAGVTVKTIDNVTGANTATDTITGVDATFTGTATVGDDLTVANETTVGGNMTITGNLVTHSNTVNFFRNAMTITGAVAVDSYVWAYLSSTCANEIHFTAETASAINNTLYISSSSHKLAILDNAGASHDLY